MGAVSAYRRARLSPTIFDMKGDAERGQLSNHAAMLRMTM